MTIDNFPGGSFPEGRFLDKEGVAVMEETFKESAITMLERNLKTSLI